MFDQDTMRLLHLINSECNILSKLNRYLECIENPADVQRVLKTFEQVVGQISVKQQEHAGKGFFLAPVLRMLSFFLRRTFLRGNFVELSPYFVDQIVRLIAQQNGFIAEVKARLWIYKGENFQQLPKIFND